MPHAEDKEHSCWVAGISSKWQGFDWNHGRASDHCGLKSSAAPTEEKNLENGACALILLHLSYKRCYGLNGSVLLKFMLNF